MTNKQSDYHSHGAINLFASLLLFESLRERGLSCRERVLPREIRATAERAQIAPPTDRPRPTPTDHMPAARIRSQPAISKNPIQNKSLASRSDYLWGGCTEYCVADSTCTSAWGAVQQRTSTTPYEPDGIKWNRLPLRLPPAVNDHLSSTDPILTPRIITNI